MPPERHDDLGLQDLEVALQPDVAGGDLVRKRVAVLRRAVPDDVGDEYLAAIQSDVRQELVEQLPGGSDEGPSLEILVVSRCFAQEEDPGLAAPLARHRLACAPVKGAGRARPYLVGEHAEFVLHAR